MSGNDHPKLIPGEALMAAARLGLSYSTLWWRMRRKGLTLDEAIAAGPPKGRRPTRGIDEALAAFAVGVSPHTIRLRIHNYRCSIAEAAAHGGARRGDRRMREAPVVLDFTHVPDRRRGG